jgi:hypothetical protein
MCTTPRPSVTEDRLRDDVERSGFRTMIGSPDTNESFVFVFFVFGVLDDNVPVTIFIEDIRIEEFEFAIGGETLLGETFVGIFRVRVFVEVFHVRVCGGRILKVSDGRERDGRYKVIVHLLDVFAMIS